MSSPTDGDTFPFPPDPMRLFHHRQQVAVWAPAKVNLFLEVLGKRPDGYHEIATLMVALRRYDTLCFKEETSAAVRLHCDRSRRGRVLGARVVEAVGCSVR